MPHQVAVGDLFFVQKEFGGWQSIVGFYVVKKLGKKRATAYYVSTSQEKIDHPANANGPSHRQQMYRCRIESLEKLGKHRFIPLVLDENRRYYGPDSMAWELVPKNIEYFDAYNISYS